MNIKGTRRKNQAVNIFEQQKILAKAEEIRNSLKASTWRELETNGKFDKNDKLTFISDDMLILGCDIGSEIHYARAIDTRGRELSKSVFSFSNTKDGSLDTYDLSFRVVRFPISDDSYECIVTNLPSDEFPPERIKLLYYTRWAIEGSFRKLKYTIGLSNFHAYRPEYIKQEIRAKLIAYNITEILINHTILMKRETKYEYKVNFSVAAHIGRVFLRLTTEKDSIDVMSLLSKELIPVRNERQYPRLKTAHFRRPRYFIYRAA